VSVSSVKVPSRNTGATSEATMSVVVCACACVLNRCNLFEPGGGVGARSVCVCACACSGVRGERCIV
jgi:hypothetical protein